MDEAIRARIELALRDWVTVRGSQAAQSKANGRAQEGSRSSVTGGLHLAGVNRLVVDEIRAAGARDLVLHSSRGMTTLPGYYRASKAWDLVVTRGSQPVLAVEYKSMSGSVGNNLNNRADEIFGMAEDARQAELHGLLPSRMRRAYVFVMGDTPQSTKPVGRSSAFEDPIFRGASYLERTAIMCRRMRDTGLFHMTWAVAVKEDPFSWYEPDPEVGWDRFAADLRAAFPHGELAPNPDMENN